MSIVSGFKDFIARGNVVDLAVGVVMGTALTGVVNAIVDALINPLIALVFQAQDLNGAGQFAIGHTLFYPGAVLSALIKFVVIAFAVYFAIVLPMNKLTARFGKKKEAEVAAEERLLTEIRDLLAQGRPNWPYSGS